MFISCFFRAVILGAHVIFGDPYLTVLLYCLIPPRVGVGSKPTVKTPYNNNIMQRWVNCFTQDNKPGVVLGETAFFTVLK